MPAPNYVNTWMDQNKPGEIHNLGGDCINPKCDYEFNYNDQRKLDDHGSMTCPNCATQITHDQLWGEQAGGTTRASLTLKQMGDIAEDLIQEIGSFPGIGQVIKRFYDYHWPIDFLIGEYGVEVKANHSEAQARFKLGDGKERQNKIEYCAKNKLLPGFIGVRLNFYTDHADIFFRPGFTDTWIGNSSMRHLGTYNFAHLNPYKNPADVPKLPDQSITDVDDVPFGKSDLDDLFGPDITKEAMLKFGKPSGAIISNTDRFYVDYKGQQKNIFNGYKAINGWYQGYAVVGSLFYGNNVYAPNSIHVFSLYVDPRFRNTTLALELGMKLTQDNPGIPISVGIEEPRLKSWVLRYNQSLGYQSQEEHLPGTPGLAKPRINITPLPKAFTKIAMPWSNNVFYHLTDSSSLPSIQKHGLQPRTFSDSRPLWRNIPVDEHSVYLYPDAGRAWDYRNTLEHQKDIGRNVRPSYAGPKLLRVSDIDRANIWPDHEDFEDYIMQLRQRKDDRESGWLSEDQDLQPHEEHALQMAELHGAHNADSLKTLGNMNPEHRAKIAEDMATYQGSRLMHRGPIHPRHIEVGTPNIYDIDEIDEQFDRENPNFKIDNDLLDDPNDEDERYDVRQNAIQDWAGEKGGWFEDENDPMYGQHPYEEWDESDPWGNHFTWQPLVKPTPAPANQMSLGDAWQ